MLDVEFEEEKALRSPIVRMPAERATPKMISWAKRFPGVETDTEAQYLLIGFAVLAIIVSLFFFFNSGGKVVKRPPLSPEERSWMETGHPLNY